MTFLTAPEQIVPKAEQFQMHSSQESFNTEEPPVWSLNDLYTSLNDPQIDRDLTAAGEGAKGISRQYRGKLREISSVDFAALLREYDSLQGSIGKLSSYAQLTYSTDREDQAIGKFYQDVREQLNTISNELIFLTLEINQLDDDEIEALLTDEIAARYRPWIVSVRAFRKHQLSEEVETKLHEKSLTSRSAWVRLFDETMANMRFDVEGEQLIASQAFDRLSSPERSVREQAGKAITTTLGDHAACHCQYSQHADQRQTNGRSLARVPDADVLQKPRKSGRG